jgi:hypothetical protein
MRSMHVSLCLTVVLLSTGVVVAFPPPEKTTYLTPEEGGADFAFQGEYAGTLTHGDGRKESIGVQAIALGEGKFSGVVYKGGLPGAGWNGTDKVALTGRIEEEDDELELELQGDGYDLEVEVPRTGKPIHEAERTMEGSGPNGAKAELKHTVRKSPTLGAKPPEGAIVLFDGGNADEWEGGRIVDQLLQVGTRTKRKFRNFELHLEFRTPFMPFARGQARGNSGMYLLDQYEFQILDSFGLSGEDNECGGLYSIAKPMVNMCLPPLSWQTYDVKFIAAKYDASGKKTADAVVVIKHNGVAIHDNLVIPRNTPGGGESDESKPGSLYVQDHGDKVMFRNIWIRELPENAP